MKATIVPDATYRIQFTPQFGFRDALEIVSYLRKLGISHIYASPVTRSRRGSTHGMMSVITMELILNLERSKSLKNC